MPTLTILLDSNEYIFGLTESLEESAKLLKILSSFKVKIPRFVLDELNDNLSGDLLKKLYQLIRNSNIEIVEDKVPVSLVEKYEKELPAEDAVIAAYCEFLKVDIMISENRHFLVDFDPKLFMVLSAQSFLQKNGQ